MNYKKLGDTNHLISEIGFGCWAIGGEYWGYVDDKDSIKAIEKAIDLGINFFDTADIYGYGKSEEMLGKTLRPYRKDVIIATKVGLRWDERKRVKNDLSKEYILKAVDDSLRRLKTDYIDIYQQHWPDENTPLEQTMEALQECVKLGKVRYIGVSNLDISLLNSYLKFGKITSMQAAYHFFRRENEDLFKFCRGKNISAFVYGTLCKGLLTGKFNKDSKFDESDIRSTDRFFQGETFIKNLKFVEELKKLAKKINKTPSQISISWTLSNNSVTSAIVGAKHSYQVEENDIASDFKLKKEELDFIDNLLNNY